MTRSDPPRLGRALLRWSIPDRWRESVQGDLEEEVHRRLAAGESRAAARLRYVAESFKISLRFWCERLRLSIFVTHRKNSLHDRSTPGDPHSSAARRPKKRGHAMSQFGQDLRYAARGIAANPGYSLVIILTLAMGIGANTAIFSLVNGVLLQPLPYADDARIVLLHQDAPQDGVDNIFFSVQEIEDYRQQSRTLEEVVEYHSMGFIIWGDMEPHQVRTGVVSSNFFDVLGIQAYKGRTFLPGEDAMGTKPILVLSHEYWQGTLGGDPDILGKRFKINDSIHEVIGVLPPIPQYPRQNDVYMPISHCPTRSHPQFIADRSSRMMLVFGRLTPESTPEQSSSEVAGIADRMRQENGQHYESFAGFRASTTPLKEELVRNARPTFLILLGAAGLVLLIACANVANLALSRLLRREREMAVRAALGASRWRLVRQTVTESSLLAVLGGVFGLLLAYAGLGLLVDFAARFTPRAGEVGIDSSVLLFTLLISLTAGIFFGALPALQPGKGLKGSLSEGAGRLSSGQGKQRLRGVLVAAQIAVSLVLLTGTGLMVRSFVALQNVDDGVQPEQVLSMRVGLNFTKFSANGQTDAMTARRVFMERTVERIQSLPGVISAGLVSMVPLNQQQGRERTFTIEGRMEDQGPPRTVTLNHADPGYFRTVGIPLIQGRFFTPSDTAGSPAVGIVTQSLAKRHFPERDPIGQRVSINGGRDWATIVGVVGDIREFGLDQEPTDEIFVPFAQAPFSSQLVVRTAGDPMRLSESMISTVREIDPDQTVDSVQTLEQIRSDSIAPIRLTTMLAGLFSMLAILITAAGISGVMALSVSQRTQEIGVRRALGAQSSDITGMVLGYSLRLTVAGAVVGLAAAFFMSRYIESLLFQVSPTDPFTFLFIPGLLIGIALLASYLPARRAVQVDPRDALHYG